MFMKNPQIGKMISVFVVFLMFFLFSFPEANALITFQDDTFHDIDSEAILIDANDTGSQDTSIQFGNDVTPGQNAILRWDIVTDELQLTNGDYSDGSPDIERSNLSFEIEVAAALPGGADGPDGPVGDPLTARGRLVQLTSTDLTAPGCTVNPNCAAGTYIWDGGAWLSLVGAPTSTNLTKVVTVGSVGADYTDIDTAAAYLQTRGGGIMLLSAETHVVTTAVNLTNVIMVGKDASRSIVDISGAGQFDSFDTTYEFLTLDVNAITATYALDVQAGSTSLIANFVDINVQDSGDSLIDSSAGTAPTATLKLIKSNDSGGAGDILKTVAGGNLNAASNIFIDSRSGDSPLEVNDWPVTLAGGGSVSTTGIITPIPADSITVSPQMNLQGAIDSIESVGNGGLITLLPGTHTLIATLTIQDHNIVLQGFGDASVISVSGVATGVTAAAIQIGTADGTAPVNGVVLKDFKLEVTGTGANDIHGLRAAGGTDLIIDNVTVQKVSGASGTGATAHMGIHFIDGTALQLVRPVIINSRVFGNGPGNYFTDGIHVTSDPVFPGVFGNNQGVSAALIDGNNVDFVAETSYVFVGVDNSSLFNNRATRMGVGGGGYGVFMGAVTNTTMTANVFSGSLDTNAIAIGIDSFNTGSLKVTSDSLFNGNIVDGFGNGGVGFATGFQIGNATNVNVLRNSFENNSIIGASPTGGGGEPTTTLAFDIRGNQDDNSFSFNSLSGGTNPWVTGFNLVSVSAERNLVLSNRFVNVTNHISDVATSTLIGSDHHRDTVAPAITDDEADGYDVGDTWIDETANAAYVLVDSTVGAADWNQIDSAGGGGTLDASYNLGNTIGVDATGGNLLFNLTNTEDFIIQDAGVTFATFTDAGDFDLLNNLTVGASAETLTDVGFVLNGDDVFIADSLGVEGAIYTDDTQTKFLYLDIGGGRTSSVQGGGKIGNRIPVLRFDPDADSRARWSIPLPDDYVSGDVTYTVFWSPSNTDTGNVNWEVDIGSIPNTELLNAGDWQTKLDVNEAGNGVTNQLQEEAFILGAAEITVGDTMYFAVNRDGADAVNDTFTGNVDIHAVRIDYTGKKLR
jgi:hypothetical protein